MSGEAERKGDSNEGHVWRSNGALEILLSALLRVEQRTAALLARDDSIIARAKAFVAKHFEPLAAAGFEGRPEEVLSAEERAELSQLSALILNGVALLTCDIRTANLMAAIDLEAEVNQFLFLHLSEPVVDHIDRLSVAAKLEIAHALLGRPEFKGSCEQEAVKRLFDWRDAFVHGKLPGIRKPTLGEIHLTTLREMGPADPERELKEMLDLLGGYLAVRRHLRAISTHPGIFSSLVDFPHVEQTVQRIKAIQRTRFKGWHLSETEKRRAVAERMTGQHPSSDG